MVKVKVTTTADYNGVNMDISIAELKAMCSNVLNDRAVTRQPVVITNLGEPVARLMPIESQIRDSGFG